MFCTKCGAKLSDGAKFCTKCGAPVAVVSAPIADAFDTDVDATAVAPVIDTPVEEPAADVLDTADVPAPVDDAETETTDNVTGASVEPAADEPDAAAEPESPADDETDTSDVDATTIVSDADATTVAPATAPAETPVEDVFAAVSVDAPVDMPVADVPTDVTQVRRAPTTASTPGAPTAPSFESGAGDSGKRGGKRKLLLVAVAILVVLAAGAGGAYVGLSLVGTDAGSASKPTEKTEPTTVDSDSEGEATTSEGEATTSEGEGSSVTRKEGNTVGNSANGGNALSVSGYDYFISSSKGGVYRAKDDGDDLEEVYSPESSKQTIKSLNYDNGRVFFLETTDNGGDSGKKTCVKSVKPDGSDEQTVSELETPDGDIKYSYSNLYIYDGTMYVVARGWNTDTSTRQVGLKVTSFKEDGSDEKEILSETGTDFMSCMVTKDRVFWTVYSPSSSSSANVPATVYSQKLDGTDREEVYSSTADYLGFADYRDDRIYLVESSNNYTNDVYFSMKTDGSDYKEITSFTDGKDELSCFIGSDEKDLFFATTSKSSGEVERLWRVSRDGGKQTEIDCPVSGLLNPTVYDAGDRVILMGSDKDGKASGVQVVVMKSDGTDAQSYVGGSN